MTMLKGFQKTYLRGIAHGIKPVVLIGREGVTEMVIRAVDEGLARHELIKIKFNDLKQKDQKKAVTCELATRTDSEPVGMIGHVAILYRTQADPTKKRIDLPSRAGDAKTAVSSKTPDQESHFR
jgi:RNA-binding protein